MKKLLWGIIATLGLSGSAIADTNWAEEYLDQYARYSMWTVACGITPYSCVGVQTPKMKRVAMRPGLLGFYDGSDTVYVNMNLNGIDLKEVLVHEMVHYLQVQVGGLKVPGRPEPICRAEEEAFTLVDKWLIKIGYKNMVVGPDWWRPYVHCWPYYNPNFDLWEWLEAEIKILFPFK
jgi:hypothetical protein